MITIKGKSRYELNKITELVNNLDAKEKFEKEKEKIMKDYRIDVLNASRKDMNMPPIKPQGMLYVLKDESMLELAKQIVNAVEYSIEIPKGLEFLKFDIKQETINRLHELTDYLKTYADWRK